MALAMGRSLELYDLVEHFTPSQRVGVAKLSLRLRVGVVRMSERAVEEMVLPIPHAAVGRGVNSGILPAIPGGDHRPTRLRARFPDTSPRRQRHVLAVLGPECPAEVEQDLCPAGADLDAAAANFGRRRCPTPIHRGQQGADVVPDLTAPAHRVVLDRG